MNFAGKRVLIMGLGVLGGGLGLARFFVQKKAKVKVTDLKTKKELAPSLSLLAGLPITYVLGEHRPEDFKNADLVIRNPDVPKDSPYLKIAKKHHVPVEMDESLFLRLCPVRKNVIGVTGTRGKTTTTHLIRAILKRAGYQVALGGNLPGTATLSLLDRLTSKTYVVLELSSWQLQGLDWDKLSPHIAVITNIYPDHLNRYQSLADYIADKKIIFKYQKRGDFLVLNQENKTTRGFARQADSKIVWFSKSLIANFIASSLKLPGVHNLENLAAAFSTTKILGVNDKIIKEAASEFRGVPFRLEEVATIAGVTYINDTTSSTPVAGSFALKAYAGKPIILIAGGSTKNLDLTSFGQEIEKRVKAVVLLEGSATSELEKAIKNKRLILGRFDKLKEAVLAAKDTARPGEIILLSPGCASFGMFRNEFDRGEQFNEIVFSFKEKTKTS